MLILVFILVTCDHQFRYSKARPEELKYIEEIGLKTGVCVDPTYTGKALYHMVEEMNTNVEYWQGKKVLFVHTGGLLSLFDWTKELKPGIEAKEGKILRLHVDKEGCGFTEPVISS